MSFEARVVLRIKLGLLSESAPVSATTNALFAIKTNAPKLLVFKCAKAPKPEAKFNIDPPGDGLVKGTSDSRMKEAVTAFQERVRKGPNQIRVYPVDHFLRGNTDVDQQTYNLAHGLTDVFNGLERKPDDVKQFVELRPKTPTLVVTMSGELHDAVARMLRDVDPRSSSKKMVLPT